MLLNLRHLTLPYIIGDPDLFAVGGWSSMLCLYYLQMIVAKKSKLSMYVPYVQKRAGLFKPCCHHPRQRCQQMEIRRPNRRQPARL